MKKWLRILLISSLLFLSFGKVSSVHAQVFKLQLDNPSQKICVGDNVKVKVMINTNNVDTVNGDALISYDSAKMKIDESNVTSGSFFTYFSAKPLGGNKNKFLISSWEESVAHAKKSSADTLFATMGINPLATGSSALTFDCKANNEADTNINRASDSVDIVNCSALTALNFTVSCVNGTPVPTTPVSPTKVPPTSTPVPTATPKPTSVPVSTSTPKPTATPRPTVAELKRAGTAETTFAIMGIGVVLTVVGVLFIL